MSKFFRALEKAERDNAQREPLVPAEPVSERASVVPRWPEPANEQPPVFSAPAPPRGPRPAVEPARPTVEPPRVASALQKAVGFVFNAHPTPLSLYFDYGNGHGRTRPWHRKGESS